MEAYCVSYVSHMWVLLLYNFPPEPSAPRVALWRKLKKLSALLVHDAVWALPANPATCEQVCWLAQEIREAGGDDMVWTAHEESAGQDAEFVPLFVDRAERGWPHQPYRPHQTHRRRHRMRWLT